MFYLTLHLGKRCVTVFSYKQITILRETCMLKISVLIWTTLWFLNILLNLKYPLGTKAAKKSCQQ